MGKGPGCRATKSNNNSYRDCCKRDQIRNGNYIEQEETSRNVIETLVIYNFGSIRAATVAGAG